MSMPAARAPHPALAAWAALREHASGRGALVTLVRADGGASKPVGAHLALATDGRAYGSVTIGGCADGRALAVAREVLRSGRRELLTLPLSEDDALALGLGCAGEVELLIERVGHDDADPLRIALDAADAAMEDGLRGVLVTPLVGPPGRIFVAQDGVCAGSAGNAGRDGAARSLAAAALQIGDAGTGVQEAAGEAWLVQLLAPVRTLLIVGATEVAAALCALVAPLAWRTVLIDAREELLNEPRFAAASERLPSLPAEAVAANTSGTSTAVIVVAHDYKVERPVLRTALAGDASYVGMLGSRKRAAAIRAMLADDGVGEDALARLHAPIGLAIGAQGAAEIAVSIIAEVISTWRAGSSRGAGGDA